MKYTIPTIIAAATLVVAAPHNISRALLELSERSTFQGSVNWFQRYDCHNACVEDGLCFAGEESEGMKGSEDDFIGWDAGCWDRPAGAHSLAISTSNGHKFSAMPMTCAEWKAAKYDTASVPMEIYNGYNDEKAACNVFPGEKMKAVFYHWTD